MKPSKLYLIAFVCGLWGVLGYVTGRAQSDEISAPRAYRFIATYPDFCNQRDKRLHTRTFVPVPVDQNISRALYVLCSDGTDLEYHYP